MTESKNLDEKCAAQIAMQTLSLLKYYAALGLSSEGLTPSHIYLQTKDPRNIIVKIPNFHLSKLLSETIKIDEKEQFAIVGS